MSREKRRYYSEEEDGRARKRRRTTETVDIEDRLESLITRVGEKSTSSLESNLEGLANVLEADLPNYKERILKIICTCATNLPEKITIYSTLVGLLNAKSYSCGEEVRFLADLVNCRVLMHSGLLEFFDKFLAATMEDNAPQARSDWFVYTVLSSLPWAAKELSEKKSLEFERLLSTIESYISQRQKTHIPALRVWSSDEPHPQEEYLDCLWAQIKKLKSDNWQEKHIRRPYLAFDDVLGDALQHTLPSFALPAEKDGTVYPLPSVVYRMFDYTDVPEGPSMPGAHAIERYLIEEGIRRTIHAHFKDRKECANQLLNLPGKSKVPINYCVIEVIFSEMFRLPMSYHTQVFYGSLIMELCKLRSDTIPGIVAQATELLYERIDTMNTTCVESNFQFKWSWDEWVSATDAGLETPRCVFLNELFERIRRLSYHQFLVENIPEGLHGVLPAVPTPNYRYSDEEGKLAGQDKAKELIDAIRAKKDVDHLQTILNNIPANATGQEDDNADAPVIDHTFPVLRLEVLLQVVFKLGSKSLSHSFSALTRFHKLLKNVIVNEEAQIHCLKILHEFWSSNHQIVVVLVDKLVRMQITDCSAVVNWLFSKDMKENFTRLYVWEIMTSTLKKMSKHTSKVSGEVQEAKEKVAKLEEKAKKQVNGVIDEIQAGEANGNSNLEPGVAEDLSKKQKQLEELTEKLENAQRTQKQLFLIVFQNHNQVFQYLSSLETLLFTSDLDPRILNLFNHFKALRSKDKVEDFYDIGDEIGRGQFAVVKKCVEKSTNTEFAAKFVKKKRSLSSRRGATAEQIAYEAELLRKVQHDGVIYLHDAFERTAEFTLVLELLSGGELFEFLIEQDYLTENEAMSFIQQVVEAVDYIHNRHIVHLDIKPENIVLNNKKEKKVKLIDFGLARIIPPGDVVKAIIGTPEFVAPEVISYEPVGTPTDMWLSSGASPFLGEDPNETFVNIQNVEYRFDEKYFADISPQAKDFISSLLIKNSSDRLSARDCLTHPWLKKSLKKVIAINRLAVLGKRSDACRDLFPEGDSCSDASDSDTEGPDHSTEKRTTPTNSKLLEDKTNAVLHLNDSEQLKSSTIDSTPKNSSDGCSKK
ncbi:hypothetical protein pdam_00014025 [Pocillopora damicornis]|uniref:Protein kinase domain-containing protein n=1 Tax=Pocillopora damicornis TaxID=46731 RepID=A0A3M6TV06_POCDA|nr:hypothetical protein pdam_00014025 [Pocillopora damicornis]